MNPNAESIFDSPSQVLQGIKPEDIRPIYDRVVIRDLGESDAEKCGSIWIPEVSRDKARLRIGLVVAVGPGDAWTEHGLDAQGEPRRRGVTIPCYACNGTGLRNGHTNWDSLKDAECPACHGTGRKDQWFNPRSYRMEKARLPMMTKPGDRVLYDVRKDERFYVDGQTLYLVHEEQACIAILED